MKELPEANGGGLPTRHKYVDIPNEPATGGLSKYWHILWRRKGTVLLVDIG